MRTRAAWRRSVSARSRASSITRRCTASRDWSSLVGIRYTTARGDAAVALDLLLQPVACRRPARANTERKPLVGGDLGISRPFEATRTARAGASSAAGRWTAAAPIGTEYPEVLALADANAADATVLRGTGTLLAEATFAVQSEMAVRLEDVVLRRTEVWESLSSGPGGPGGGGGRMRELLGWSAEREQAELTATDEVLARHGAQSAPEEVAAMRLLLTGGTGFIGSRLALEARQRQIDVVVTGMVKTDAERSRVAELERAGSDRGRRSRMRLRASRRLRTATPSSTSPPLSTSPACRTAIRGRQRRRHAQPARGEPRCGVRRFVYGSTIGVYGSAANGTLDESSPPNPDNIYGRTKLAAERVVREEAGPVETSIVRISETYGPGDFRLLEALPRHRSAASS